MMLYPEFYANDWGELRLACLIGLFYLGLVARGGFHLSQASGREKEGVTMADVRLVLAYILQAAKDKDAGRLTQIRRLAHTQRQAELRGEPIGLVLEDDQIPERHRPLSLSHIDRGLRTSKSSEEGAP